jgi:hypothetical protein
MALYSSEFSALHNPFPGVEVLDVGGGRGVDEFNMIVSSLHIPRHYDDNGRIVDQRPAQKIENTASMSRTPTDPREPWAPDHRPHSDMTYWGNKNLFATVLYAERLEGEVAGTGIFDTALLARAIESDHPGILEELAETTVTFSVAKYYLEVLAKEATHESIARTLRNKGVPTLEEVADLEARRYPARTFPTLPNHRFRENAPAIMIDGVRTQSINGLDQTRGQKIINMFENDYVLQPPEFLAEQDYYHAHEWEEGDLLIFPQKGSLHQALPSPEGELRRDTKRLFIA